MSNSENEKDSALAKLTRRFSIGEYLCKQGDMGNTMFLIMDGSVLLFHKGVQAERLVGTLNAGEVLGEKAIVKGPYRRTFTAQAKAETTALELDKESWKLVATKMPDLTMKMISMLAERLDQANELIGILQSTDDVDRCIQYIGFFCRQHCKKTADGIEMNLTADDLHHAINLNLEKATQILDELVRQKLLVKKKTGFLVPDEKLLLAQITSLRKELNEAA